MSDRLPETSPAARALEFIEDQGDPLTRCWARAVVEPAAVEPCVEWLGSLQCEDGGFSADGQGAGSLLETRRALELLDDVGIRGGSLLERACRHLSDTQRADGGWGSGADAAPDDDIFETGMILTHLAKSPSARLDLLEAGADFLCRFWSPDRVQGFVWRPIAAYAGTFANLPHDRADEILQWCGRELERGFRARQFDGVQTARVLAWCDAPALPGARLERKELLQSILDGQAEDGGWSPSPGASDDDRVSHTLSALVGLRLLG